MQANHIANRIGAAFLGSFFFLLIGCAEPELPLGQSASSNATSVQSNEKKTDSGSALDIFKSPTCGCCDKWVEHIEQRGFTPTTYHPADLSELKAEQGVAPQYQSCHTAVSAEGYVFEGHIPARYIRDFLANPPADTRGLAVPAMPVGSPGMEVEDRFMPYEVLLLKADGGVEVFARVQTPAQQYQ